MKAYPDTYTSHAQIAFGSMLQTAVCCLGLKLAEFYALFLSTSYAGRFSQGDVAIVAGRSGGELALMVMEESGRLNHSIPAGRKRLEEVVGNVRETPTESTPTYWAGWALAYYQWASGLTFAQIDDLVSIDDVRNMYDPYHEMDVRSFCAEMDRLCEAARGCTPCKAARLAAGLSQSELARLSGVPVRSIQQYEQRQKNINRASAETVFALARALACDPAALLEHTAREAYEYAVVQLPKGRRRSAVQSGSDSTKDIG